MKTGFGWTLLSREALKNAEAHLREHTQGVRDEVGFLVLHQAYADRFFPGTSVLQTRLRYALFVPWIYERLLARPPAERADRAVEREEVQLAGRLKKSNAENIIGGRNYPEPTSQPPTLVYWTALGTWGILRPLLGQLPSRTTIHQLLVLRMPRSNRVRRPSAYFDKKRWQDQVHHALSRALRERFKRHGAALAVRDDDLGFYQPRHASPAGGDAKTR